MHLCKDESLAIVFVGIEKLGVNSNSVVVEMRWQRADELVQSGLSQI